MKVVQCRRCDLEFLNPHPSPEAMVESYSSTARMRVANEKLSQYYENFEGSETERFYKHCLDVIGRIKRSGRLLDIGCGRGQFLKIARDFGWAVMGLEPGREHAEYASEKLGMETVNAAVDKAMFDEGYFDIITLWDIIEHLNNPKATLRRISHWLKPDGLLLIATPNHASLLDFLVCNIYGGTGGFVKWPLHYFYVAEHILYFTPKTLRDLMWRSGFQVIKELKTGTDIERYAVASHIRVIAKVLLFLSKLVGLENRIITICRKKDTIS